MGAWEALRKLGRRRPLKRPRLGSQQRPLDRQELQRENKQLREENERLRQKVTESRSPDIPPARNVRFQVAGDGAARGAGLGRGPGKACPICGRGGTLKRIVSRDPGKTVAVSVSVSHSACTARVRCGELSG